MRRPKLREIRRAALYVRVSSREQAMGYSPETQESDLRDWAESKGWEVTGVYKDLGATGTTVKGRFDFQRMIADALRDGCDAILVDKNDRFARSRRDSALYKGDLGERGIRVLSRTEPGIGDPSPSGVIIDGLFDSWAAFYSLQLSDNVTRAKAARAQKGLPLGDIPFGYRSIGPKLPPEVVPEEAEALSRAFLMYAGGNRSILEVADAINGVGLRPRSKRGHEAFSKASISKMLSNPFYVGDITYHGEVIGKGLHERIIARDLWERVQRVRAERAWRPQVFGARPKRPYLLAGIAVCSNCGAPVWANTTGGGRNNYYRCASRNRGGACSERVTSCRCEAPEAEVSSLFSRLELPFKWRQRVEAVVRENDAVVDVEKQRRHLEEKIRRVRQGLVDGVLDYDMAKQTIRATEAALAAIGDAREAVVRPAEVLTDIPELWPKMTPDERSQLVKLVLAKVEIDLRTGTVGGVIPKPAFAPLFRVLAEEEGGLVSFCDWRPRWDSNPRSPP